jgi:hypothetical protein
MTRFLRSTLLALALVACVALPAPPTRATVSTTATSATLAGATMRVRGEPRSASAVSVVMVLPIPGSRKHAISRPAMSRLAASTWRG